MADLGQIRQAPLKCEFASNPQKVRVWLKSAAQVRWGVEGGIAWVAILFPLPLALNSSSFALFFSITCDLGLFIDVNCSFSSVLEF
jgi:hypothetical protein